MLFELLLKRNVCPRIIKLLLYIDGHESKPANSNFSIFILFDKFEGNTFLHNVLKISFLACRYTPLSTIVKTGYLTQRHFSTKQNRLETLILLRQR